VGLALFDKCNSLFVGKPTKNKNNSMIDKVGAVLRAGSLSFPKFRREIVFNKKQEFHLFGLR